MIVHCACVLHKWVCLNACVWSSSLGLTEPVLNYIQLSMCHDLFINKRQKSVAVESWLVCAHIVCTYNRFSTLGVWEILQFPFSLRVCLLRLILWWFILRNLIGMSFNCIVYVVESNLLSSSFSYVLDSGKNGWLYRR